MGAKVPSGSVAAGLPCLGSPLRANVTDEKGISSAWDTKSRLSNADPSDSLASAMKYFLVQFSRSAGEMSAKASGA